MYLSYSIPGARLAQRALNLHTKNFSKNIEQLATGKQILSAADDPGGLSIASNMKAKIASADSAKKNISDAISLLNTTDSALETVSNLLSDIRADFVSATTGTPSAGDIDAYQASINENIDAIGNLAAQTEFNGFSLLDGSQNFTIQTGVNNGETTTLNFQADSGTDYQGIAVSITQVVGTADEGHLVENSGSAGFSLDQLSVGATNVNAHDGGNYVTTPSGLDVIDTMIDNVARMRGTVGGQINGMNSRLENMTAMQANWESVRENREDVDVAKVSAEMSKNKILRESAAAILAQANTGMETVLTLLP